MKTILLQYISRHRNSYVVVPTVPILYIKKLHIKTQSTAGCRYLPYYRTAIIFKRNSLIHLLRMIIFAKDFRMMNILRSAVAQFHINVCVEIAAENMCLSQFLENKCSCKMFAVQTEELLHENE